MAVLGRHTVSCAGWVVEQPNRKDAGSKSTHAILGLFEEFRVYMAEAYHGYGCICFFESRYLPPTLRAGRTLYNSYERARSSKCDDRGITQAYLD